MRHLGKRVSNPPGVRDLLAELRFPPALSLLVVDRPVLFGRCHCIARPHLLPAMREAALL